MEPEPKQVVEGKKKEKKGPGKKEMTLDRLYLAQERTLLAWVRTSTMFLTFGFALYKFLEAQIATTKREPLLGFLTPRLIGISMLTTGLIGLIFAMIRFYRSLEILRKYSDKPFRSAAMLQAYLVLALITLLLYAALTGPSLAH